MVTLDPPTRQMTPTVTKMPKTESHLPFSFTKFTFKTMAIIPSIYRQNFCFTLISNKGIYFLISASFISSVNHFFNPWQHVNIR